MAGAARLGDPAKADADAHGCPSCPHPGLGPAVRGSTNVLINARNALRQTDAGVHTACCGANSWLAVVGSTTVFINGKPAMRKGDTTLHCGVSPGRVTLASTNVVFG